MDGFAAKSDANPVGKTVPKYIRVRDQLHDDIRSGRLAAGQLLPPEAKLMEVHGISRYTIRQALAELENDGFIQRIQGRGTFVTTAQQRESFKQLDTFALIAPQLREGMYPSLVEGFEQAGARFQHQVVVGKSGNDVGRQADLVLQMIDRMVGGVAIVPTTSASHAGLPDQTTAEAPYPGRVLSPVGGRCDRSCVTWNAREVGRAAAMLLRENGHRHIACLASHRYFMTNEFEHGLRDVMSDGASAADNVRLILYGLARPEARTAQEIQHALEEVMADPVRPTAVFCGNLPDAEQVYLHAQAIGLKVPRDLSLVYFGSARREHGLAEHISCVAVDEREIGVRAACLLHEMRVGKRAIEDDERIVFPVMALPGETVAPVGAGAS